MDARMRHPGLFPSFASYEVESAGAPERGPGQVSRVAATTSGPGASESTTSGAERRQSGTRARARDRLMDRATRSYPESETLTQARGVENLVLFIDDDLRETGMALGNVENYLVGILRMLEQPRMSREDVHALAADTQVLDHVDMLVETLETLRRRLARLAASLR